MTEHRRRGRGARPGTRQQDPRITKASETAVGAQLREDREALAAERAEVAAERATPKVLPEQASIGTRVRRWFTGGE